VASAQRATQRALHQSIEASEQERARWARELHDQTLQDVGALRVLLTTARNTNNAATVDAAVDEAIGRLGEMGGALRELISDLRPALLDQLGLAPALEAMADRVARDHQIEVGMEMDLAYEEGRLPDRLGSEIELAIYRVVQEAVTNAAKHSGADRVDVTIVEHDGTTVDVSIQDTGQGFEPSASHAGFGLTGIRERVAQHGGNLEIASGPGRGAQVKIVMPARHVSDEAAGPPLSVGLPG
jgi:signal transduction histidine kinase